MFAVVDRDLADATVGGLSADWRLGIVPSSIPETDITKADVVVGVFPRTTINPFSGLGTIC